MRTKLTFKYNFEPTQSPEAIELEQFWAAYGIQIEAYLNKITGFSFVEDITCHLNTEYSKSYPILRLKIEDIQDMKDGLIHELIHILLSQNSDKGEAQWQDLMKEYEAETQLCRVHIAVHRIHYLLDKKLFPERLEAIQNYSVKPDYVRSWQIANTESKKIDKILHLST